MSSAVVQVTFDDKRYSKCFFVTGQGIDERLIYQIPGLKGDQTQLFGFEFPQELRTINVSYNLSGDKYYIYGYDEQGNELFHSRLLQKDYVFSVVK